MSTVFLGAIFCILLSRATANNNLAEIISKLKIHTLTDPNDLYEPRLKKDHEGWERKQWFEEDECYALIDDELAREVESGKELHATGYEVEKKETTRQGGNWPVRPGERLKLKRTQFSVLNLKFGKKKRVSARPAIKILCPTETKSFSTLRPLQIEKEKDFGVTIRKSQEESLILGAEKAEFVISPKNPGDTIMRIALMPCTIQRRDDKCEVKLRDDDQQFELWKHKGLRVRAKSEIGLSHLGQYADFANNIRRLKVQKPHDYNVCFGICPRLSK